jgi:hypothetical protein
MEFEGGKERYRGKKKKREKRNEKEMKEISVPPGLRSLTLTGLCRN